MAPTYRIRNSLSAFLSAYRESGLDHDACPHMSQFHALMELTLATTPREQTADGVIAEVVIANRDFLLWALRQFYESPDFYGDAPQNQNERRAVTNLLIALVDEQQHSLLFPGKEVSWEEVKFNLSQDASLTYIKAQAQAVPGADGLIVGEDIMNRVLDATFDPAKGGA